MNSSLKNSLFFLFFIILALIIKTNNVMFPKIEVSTIIQSFLWLTVERLLDFLYVVIGLFGRLVKKIFEKALDIVVEKTIKHVIQRIIEVSFVKNLLQKMKTLASWTSIRERFKKDESNGLIKRKAKSKKQKEKQ